MRPSKQRPHGCCPSCRGGGRRTSLEKVHARVGERTQELRRDGKQKQEKNGAFYVKREKPHNASPEGMRLKSSLFQKAQRID